MFNTLNFSNHSIGLPPAPVTNVINQVINVGPQLNTGNLSISWNFNIGPNDLRVYYGNTNTAAGTGVLIYDSGDTNGLGGINLTFGPINGLTTNIITIAMDQNATYGNSTWTYTGSISHPPTTTGIIVGGSFNVAGQIYNNIARLSTNGTLDTTFNPGTGADNLVLSLGYQFNGQVVAGGLFKSINSVPLNRIARFNVDGSLDTTTFSLAAVGTAGFITLVSNSLMERCTSAAILTHTMALIASDLPV